MGFYVKLLLLLIALATVENSYAKNTSASRTQEAAIWKKPRAVISPNVLEAVKGEKATFISLSKFDDAAQISLQWSSKPIISTTTESHFTIDTSLLALGKHAVTLKITDNHGYSDSVSAILFVVKTQDELQKKEDTLYFDNLEKEIEVLVGQKKIAQSEALLPISPTPYTNGTNQVVNLKIDKKEKLDNKVSLSQAIETENLSTQQKIPLPSQPRHSSQFWILIFLGILLISLAALVVFWYKRFLTMTLPIDDISINTTHHKQKNTKAPTSLKPIIKFSHQIDMGRQEIFVASDPKDEF